MDQALPPFRGALTEKQIALAHILADAGRYDLYKSIWNFSDGKAQENFFDQVRRRYLTLRPVQENLSAYITNGGKETEKAYIEIVEELLLHNPHRGFFPPPVADSAIRRDVVNYLNISLPRLSYAKKGVVFDHVYKLHTSYSRLKSTQVEHRNDKGHCERLLEFRGDIDYVHGRDMDGKYILMKAPIGIRLPVSYPQRRPHVWIDCPDNFAMVPQHLNVAPNGLVSIPYLVDWVEDKSDVVTLVSHMCVDFTSQMPIFRIDLGINLSDEQKKLVKILVDYGQLHLYTGIEVLPANEKIALLNKVIGRYTGLMWIWHTTSGP